MVKDFAIKKSICLFCSLGCGLAFRIRGEQAVALDYDKENPVNLGSLCPRGNYNYELLNHPQRLQQPRIGGRKTDWSEALEATTQALKNFGPESIALAVGSNLSNEEAYLAAQLAKTLGTKNICPVGDPADSEAFSGYKWEAPPAQLANLEDIENSGALLIIGDILLRSPVLAKRINKMKYGKRGNKIIVIDPNKTHTSWFAATHLVNKPATEALLLAAMIKVIAEENKSSGIDLDLEKAAETAGIPVETIVQAALDFAAAPAGMIIFVPGKSKERNDLIGYFCKVLAGLCPGKKHITFYSFGNALGVNTILDREVEGHLSYEEILKKIDSGGIKTLLFLGAEAIDQPPELMEKAGRLEFLATTAYFPPAPLPEKVVLLPQASHLEADGSFLLADGRIEETKAVLPKVGSRTNLEIISALLGINLDWEKVKQETSRIISQVSHLGEAGSFLIKADLRQKIAEAREIKAKTEAALEDITHFGNNDLVKNFFWYKVNNPVAAVSSALGKGADEE